MSPLRGDAQGEWNKKQLFVNLPVRKAQQNSEIRRNMENEEETTMKKRMLSLATAIILMLSLVPAAFAADSAAATREYAIAALAEAAGIAPAAGGLEGFADADTVSPQYRDGVAKAVAAGVVRGYEDGTLRPQAPVSRLEALVLLSRCLPELAAICDAASFSDVPEWAKADVERLSAAGLLPGGDGVLGAKDALTADQVDLLADRAIGRDLLGALEAANSPERIYLRHASQYRQENAYAEGERFFVTDHYSTADRVFYVFGEDYYCCCITPTDFIYCYTGEMPMALLMPPEENAAEMRSYQSYITFGNFESETLDRIQERGGELIITTKMEEADAVRRYLEDKKTVYGDEFGTEYGKAEAVFYTYRADAQSLEMKELTEELQLTDGSRLLCETVTFAYDVPVPDPAAPDSPLAPAFDETAEKKTVTVVFAAGTPEEQTCVYVLPESTFAFLRYHGMMRNGYEDPACTLLSMGSNGRTEFTLYVSGDESWRALYAERAYGAALPLMEEAAAAGETDAAAALAYCLIYGDAAEADPERGYALALEAAEAGNDVGMFLAGRCCNLGEGTEQDYEKALAWYEKAAALGNTDAMNNLGAMYILGEGVAQDYGKAMEYYQQGAALGDPLLIWDLGNLYYFGYGVAQDYGKAMEYFQLSADLGYVYAMYDLGSMYESGEGVEKDPEKAAEWYRKALDAGYEPDEADQAHLKDVLGEAYGAEE
jgi:TPR repeat protein